VAQALDTADDFITRIRERVNDTDGDRYDNEEILGYMNAVVRQITDEVARMWPSYNLRSPVVHQTTKDIISGTAKYDLPTDFYEAINDGILVNGYKQPILTLGEYKAGNKSGVIFISDQIVISPTPDEDSTDGLQLYYVKQPTTISATSDSVPYGDEFPDMIISLVSAFCRARNEENPGFQSEVASYARRLMKAHISNINQPTDMKLGREVYHDWY